MRERGFHGSLAIQVGPHDFAPLGWLDRFRTFGRCRACYLPRIVHPVEQYVMARPLGDSSPALLSGCRVSVS